jgi:hypothetical protein
MKDNKDKAYRLWLGIKRRCNNGYYAKRKPTYTDCTMSDNFKDFPFFAAWCEKQVGWDQEGFQIDKDLLQQEKKQYSEDVCVFVPNSINSLFITRNRVRKLPLGVTRQGKKFRADLALGGKKVKSKVVDTAESAFYLYKDLKEAYAKILAETYKDRIDLRVYQLLVNFEVPIDSLQKCM